MLAIKNALLVLLLFAALASCSGGGATFVFYVVIKPAQTDDFIVAISALAKAEGLETAMSQTVYGTGDVLRFLEGRGHGLKLWVQSAMLSGHENPRLCGEYHEPHPDPAQFIVFTEPRFFGSSVEATELGERAFSQLQQSGFDVRRTPPVCGAAALRDHS